MLAGNISPIHGYSPVTGKPLNSRRGANRWPQTTYNESFKAFKGKNNNRLNALDYVTKTADTPPQHTPIPHRLVSPYGTYAKLGG